MRQTDNSSAGAVGALVLGASATAVPISGGTLLVSPQLTVAVSIGASSGQVLSFPIPNKPSLSGTTLLSQLVLVDSASATLAFSPGLQAMFGIE